MIVVGKAVVQAVPPRRWSKAKVFVAVFQKSYDSDVARYEYPTRESALKKVTKYFTSLGFQIRNGKPFDPAQPNEALGYAVFTRFEMDGEFVLEFECDGGEGPTAFTKKE